MAKDEEYKHLISTQRWVHLRRKVLAERPLCEQCKAEGRIQSATEVHHIIPVQGAEGLEAKERLMFNPDNLKALCHQCHVNIHTEMGRNGKKYHERRRKEQMQNWLKKFG